MNPVKKANFKRIAENRTNRIIDLISLLGNLSNKSFYEYDDNDIEKMFSAIENELDRQKGKFIKKDSKKRKKFEL